jgi:hypothetical protein
MRRPVLIGLIAAVALAATPALAAAAGQASSPFRDYASPARDQYGDGGGGPGNGQGNGPPDGRPPNSSPGQSGGGPPGQNGGGPPPRAAVKGATAQGSAKRSKSGTTSSTGAVKGAHASSRPVAVGGATAASIRRAPAGGLPFTGHDLTLFVLVATALLGTGALLAAGERATRGRRRRAHRAA